MKKQDIKDIVHQMISLSMESFDIAFEDSCISDKDKEYAYNLFEKYQETFSNKIKDDK